MTSFQVCTAFHIVVGAKPNQVAQTLQVLVSACKISASVCAMAGLGLGIGELATPLVPSAQPAGGSHQQFRFCIPCQNGSGHLLSAHLNTATSRGSVWSPWYTRQFRFSHLSHASLQMKTCKAQAGGGEKTARSRGARVQSQAGRARKRSKTGAAKP